MVLNINLKANKIHKTSENRRLFSSQNLQKKFKTLEPLGRISFAIISYEDYT